MNRVSPGTTPDGSTLASEVGQPLTPEEMGILRAAPARLWSWSNIAAGYGALVYGLVRTGYLERGHTLLSRTVDEDVTYFPRTAKGDAALEGSALGRAAQVDGESFREKPKAQDEEREPDAG